MPSSTSTSTTNREPSAPRLPTVPATSPPTSRPPGTEPHEQDTYDIDEGTSGDVSVSDGDDDRTVRGFGPPQYHFNVNAFDNQVWGHQWSPGSVEVSINGVETWTVPVDDGSGGMEVGDFSLDLNNASPTWNLVPTDEVTVTHVTNTTETKSHTVTALSGAYNYMTGTVDGMAPSGADVDVWVDETDPQVWRHEVAAGGIWIADFSVPGDEPPEEDGTITLAPGNLRLGQPM